MTYAVVMPPGGDDKPWRDDELCLVVVPASTFITRTIMNKPHPVNLDP